MSVEKKDTTVAPPPPSEAKAIDLMEALKASLRAADEAARIERERREGGRP